MNEHESLAKYLKKLEMSGEGIKTAGKVGAAGAGLAGLLYLASRGSHKGDMQDITGDEEKDLGHFGGSYPEYLEAKKNPKAYNAATRREGK